MRLIHSKPLQRTGFFLAIMIFALTGCKSPDVAKGFAAGNLKRVAVDSKVPVNGGLRLGLNTAGQPLTVSLANLIVDKMYAKRVAAIEKSMDENGIHLPKMVRDSFVTHLRARNLGEITEVDPEATFQIAIAQYGFMEFPLLTGNEIPFIETHVRLVDKSGRVLWKTKGLMSRRGYKGMGGSLEDYANDPAKLKKDWDTQVDQLIQSILAPPK